MDQNQILVLVVVIAVIAISAIAFVVLRIWRKGSGQPAIFEGRRRLQTMASGLNRT